MNHHVVGHFNFDSLLMDENDNLSGMTFVSKHSDNTYQVGQAWAFHNSIKKENQLDKSNSTRLIGLRTTMDCISAKTIKSIQMIYVSRREKVCKELEPLTLENVSTETEIVYCS